VLAEHNAVVDIVEGIVVDIVEGIVVETVVVDTEAADK
jgi:hypothetical protein